MLPWILAGIGIAGTMLAIKRGEEAIKYRRDNGREDIGGIILVFILLAVGIAASIAVFMV